MGSPTIDSVPILLLKTLAFFLGLVSLVAGLGFTARLGRPLKSGPLMMALMTTLGAFLSIWVWFSTITATVGIMVVIFLLHREKLIPWIWSGFPLKWRL